MAMAEVQATSGVRMTTASFALIYTGGFLSYADTQMTPSKLGAYALALTGLLLLLASQGRFSRSRLIFAGVFCFGYAQSTIASMFAAGSVAGPARVVQELLYPGVLLVSVIVLYRLEEVQRAKIKFLILFLAATNFGVALLASLGVLDEVPLFGPVSLGRVIFGTSIPSASGLSFNVNYFSVSQGCFFMLYGLVTRLDRDRRRLDIAVLALLFVSSFWGSSRGVFLSLLGAMATVLLLRALWGPFADARRARIILILAAVILTVVLSAYSDQIYDNLRLAKGLNKRDLIWSEGVSLWLQKPVLGWGLEVEIAQRFAAGALPEGVSFHSGYLHTLVRGGLALFLFSFGFMALGVVWGLGSSGRRWFNYRWAVATVVFYLLNAAFRTYSLGGMGLLPAVAATALSMCLYSRVREDTVPSEGLDDGPGVT
jgi:hypothetical protein